LTTHYNAAVVTNRLEEEKRDLVVLANDALIRDLTTSAILFPIATIAPLAQAYHSWTYVVWECDRIRALLGLLKYKHPNHAHRAKWIGMNAEATMLVDLCAWGLSVIRNNPRFADQLALHSILATNKETVAAAQRTATYASIAATAAIISANKKH
jgi:hypothetical protein